MVLILLFILKIAAVAFKTISHPECDGPVLTSTISVFISMSQSLFQRTHSFLSFAFLHGSDLGFLGPPCWS